MFCMLFLVQDFQVLRLKNVFHETCKYSALVSCNYKFLRIIPSFSICRYKIYAEGYAWSVSLKYILSCGSLALIISPQYEDFFTRGLSPKKNYWPISSTDLCPSIKYAVEWGNAHRSEVRLLLFSGIKLTYKR